LVQEVCNIDKKEKRETYLIHDIVSGLINRGI